MCDIACGIKDQGLSEFGAGLNAACVDLGLYDPSTVLGWGQAFEQVVARTLEAGGRIHFNLTGLNIAEALSGGPTIFVGRYTSYELQQIVRHAKWFAATIFYLDGKPLDVLDVQGLGITCLDH